MPKPLTVWITINWKILQAGFQQYVNRKLPDVQAGFRKGRRTRDQTANICWIIEKPRVFTKNSYFLFINYAKDFDSVDHNKVWKLLKERGIPDHMTCLLRNLYAGQEATARTGHGTKDWLEIGKGVFQGCILSSCLFNLHAEYIMRNTGLVQMVKHLPAMQETQDRSLGQEDPLEVEMATHSSILAWRIPWTE